MFFDFEEHPSVKDICERVLNDGTDVITEEITIFNGSGAPFFYQFLQMMLQKCESLKILTLYLGSASEYIEDNAIIINEEQLKIPKLEYLHITLSKVNFAP